MPPDAELPVIVKLFDKIDPATLQASVAKAGKGERLKKVVLTLREKAEKTRKGLETHLAASEREGKVKKVKPFWIFNGFALTAVPAAIRELAARPEVEDILPDRTMKLSLPAPVTAAAAPGWNLDIIGAPTLWERGFIGQGVVVASLDTGVDLLHPALGPKWRGGTNSWFDPSGEHPTTPYDNDGHGTGTMGVMVGGNTGDNRVGVAPGALWIAAKIFDDSGTGTYSTIHAAFQWVLDPDENPETADAPDVVNCSWDLAGDRGEGVGQYIDVFRTDIQTLKAAGIEVVFSAGNAGPGSDTSVSPANYPESLAVGATDENDAVAFFSSRGPSAFDGSSTYPGITAPGVHIRSTALTLNGANVNAYSDLNTGTSISAPHAAGAFALLLSGGSALTAEQAENAVTGGARDLGPAGPDNNYGYGRLDIPGAADILALGSLPPPDGDVDGNGTVNVIDALLVLEAAVGFTPRTAAVMLHGDTAPLADVNGAPTPKPDGDIDVADALNILRKAVGLVSW